MKTIFHILSCIVLVFVFGCTPTKKQTVKDALWNIHFKSIMQAKDSSTFAIRPIEDSRMVSYEPNSFYQSAVTCEVDLPKLPPGEKYCLYCPHVGFPSDPEITIGFTVDEAGLIKHELSNGEYGPPTPKIRIPLPDIKGFCSDWYLFSLGSVMFCTHTTYNPHPIYALGSQGQKIELNKMDVGGNILTLHLSGFRPYEHVSILSDSAGEKLPLSRRVHEDGSYTLLLMPQVVGKEKGIDTIAVTAGHETLKVECEWDMSTLQMKRKQPYSVWHHLFPLSPDISFSSL